MNVFLYVTIMYSIFTEKIDYWLQNGK